MASASQLTITDKVRDTAKVFGKTKLCKFFATGSCKKAPNCPFAHGLGELRQSPDLRKTSICKDWRTREGCSLSAEQCPFAHGKRDLRRSGPFFHAQKDALALSRTSSQEDGKGTIQSDDSCSSTVTGSDFKRTLCRTLSNPGSDTIDIHSDCSSTSSSTGGLLSPESKDLSWDPIGLQQRPQSFGVEFSQDACADEFNSLFLECTRLVESMHIYKMFFHTVASSHQSDMGNISDTDAPSLDAATILGMNHCQQLIVPATRPVAMTPVLVPVSWTPLATGADDLEQILRSAQPDCYED